jgi:hypothetical protein
MTSLLTRLALRAAGLTDYTIASAAPRLPARFQPARLDDAQELGSEGFPTPAPRANEGPESRPRPVVAAFGTEVRSNDSTPGANRQPALPGSDDQLPAAQPLLEETAFLRQPSEDPTPHPPPSQEAGPIRQTSRPEFGDPHLPPEARPEPVLEQTTPEVRPVSTTGSYPLDEGRQRPVTRGDPVKDRGLLATTSEEQPTAARPGAETRFTRLNAFGAGVRGPVPTAPDERGEPDVVYVTIGRIDVRASAPAQASPPVSAQPASGDSLSLRDYLRGRREVP